MLLAFDERPELLFVMVSLMLCHQVIDVISVAMFLHFARSLLDLMKVCSVVVVAGFPCFRKSSFFALASLLISVFI